jgi:uncharacterized membrane protein
MEAYIFEWLSLFFRWFHVIAGIAWIGASFYFIWLDLSLREPPEWKKEKGIKGDLWAIHGGGFYEVAKYQLGPQTMPKKLHWFKWEAYTTWLTGFALLAIIYYWGATQYLLDPQKMVLTPIQGIAISLGFLLVGVGLYEAMLRSALRYWPRVFGAILFSLLIFSAWMLDQVFSDRAAYLHIGALIGTIMVGNVKLGIMPAQRELVRAVEAGEVPNADYAAFAKLRSTHNNYFTLPLIFLMISNHYPMTYGHEYPWLVLAALGGLTALVRHYFNLKHQDQHKPWILVVGIIGLLLIAAWMTPIHLRQASTAAVISETQALALVQVHCGGCHAGVPTQAGFATAPAGIVLARVEQLQQFSPRIVTALQTGYMPLGNMKGMTEQERSELIQWLTH